MLNGSIVRARLLLLSIPLCLLTGIAGAAPFAAPEQIAPAHAGSGALRVTVALLLVIGAVVVAGRIARRMRGVGSATTAGLEVIGQLPLGPRERAVLVRIGDRQLLLGVAPGSVQTLHVFDGALPASLPLTEPAIDRPTFKSILLKSLGK